MSEHSQEPSADNIGARARTAVGWRALSQFSNQGIRIVVSIILARLLMPDDFGIVGMAAIVTGLAAVFRDLGLGQALVQRPELREEHTRSAFWATLIMGGLLYAAMYFGAPYAGDYFNDERMVPVLRIMALSFLITPFGVVPRSLLQRELDFKRPFLADLAGTVTYGAVGITTALLGHGYWSLVWALLASSAAGTLAICVIMRYAPPLIPALGGAPDLFGFGAGVTGVGVLSYISRQIDYIIVGRCLSAAALGLYKRAYMLAEIPAGAASGIMYPILFSGFARIQSDRPRLAGAFKRAEEVCALVGFAALAILAAVAPEFIPWVLGDQWVDAVRPTQYLAVFGAMMVVGYPQGALLKGSGLIGIEVVLQAARAVMLAIGTWLGVRHGVCGVALGVAIAYCLQIALNVTALGRYRGLGPREHWHALRQPAIVGMATFGAASGIRGGLLAVVPSVHPGLALACAAVAALTVALTLGKRLAPHASHEIAAQVHKVLRGARAVLSNT